VRYWPGRLHGESARLGWHAISTDEVLSLLTAPQLLALQRGERTLVEELELTIRAARKASA
jgi:hypothetical protein